MKNLFGSEKQIAWAEQIIAENIATLTRTIEEFKGREVRENCSYSNVTDRLKKALDDLSNSEYSAKWWIEHKNVANAYIQKVLHS